MNPFVANAVTTTPDGTVHVISLRLVDLSSTSGDLLYSFGPATGPIESVPGQALVGDGAGVGAVSLQSDSAGNLYVAYLRPAGAGLEIRTLRNGATEWETLATLSSSAITGFDLATRADGGTALSYYDPARPGTGLDGAQIRYFSDVDPRSGNRTSTFQDYNAFTTTDREGTPLNTTCVFLPDGKPRIAFALRGPVKYLQPSTSSFAPFTAAEPAVGFIDATLEMVARGNEIHLLAHTSTDGGTLARFAT